MRLALIGGGDHGLHGWAVAAAQLPGWSIVAVADPDVAARERAAAMLPHARMYADHRALLEGDDRFDLVVVATPPTVTAKIADVVMNTNAAVLIEKPGAVLSTELGALPGTRVHPVSVAYCYRFHPTVMAFRAALPEVGSLENMELCFTAPVRAAGTWRAARVAGGGALRDLGSHVLDLARVMLNAPLALTRASIRSLRTDDDQVELECSAGATRLRVHCAYHGGASFSLEATGSRGRLRADLFSMTTPARGWLGSMSSKVRTRLPGPRHPGTAIARARMDMLQSAITPSAAHPPASLADAAAILRLVEVAEARALS